MTTTADTQAAAPATKTVRVAYVLTLQFPMGGMNHAVMEHSGVLDVSKGYSRHETFQQLRQRMIDSARQQGLSGVAEPSTLFFSLERDAL